MLRMQNWPAEIFAVTIFAALSMNPAHGATLDDTGAERSAFRNNVERYYWSHRLVGSYVLNMQGQNIGRVNALVVDERGTLTKMLIDLNERFDIDGTPVPIEPYRAEIVSAGNAHVTIIRINLTRDELVRAQLSQFQWRAQPSNTEPAARDAGAPVMQ